MKIFILGIFALSVFSCKKDLTSNFEGIWEGDYRDSNNVLHERKILKIESVSQSHLILYLPDERVIGSDAFNKQEFGASDGNIIIKGYLLSGEETLIVSWQEYSQNKFYSFSGERIE